MNRPGHQRQQIVGPQRHHRITLFPGQPFRRRQVAQGIVEHQPGPGRQGLGATALGRLPPGRIDGEGKAGDPTADQGVGRSVGRAQGDVGLAFGQVEELVVQNDAQHDAWIRGLERGQGRAEQTGREIVRGGHVQRAAQAQVAAGHPALHGVDLGVDPFRRGAHLVSGQGQGITLPMAFE